jgi:hypothetical protein
LREVDMVRHQLHIQVGVGQWRDHYSLYQKLEQLVRAKNLAPTQLWGATVGPINSAILVTDYETLEAYNQNTKAFTNDPDIMNVWREMSTHVEGIPWDELWESASQIA